MDQKRPIKRKRNCQVHSYTNENSEIVIKTCIEEDISMRVKINEEVDNLSRESIVEWVEPYSEQQINLDEYRRQRKKVDILNTYMMSTLALAMITVEFALMIFLRIYLTWSQVNGFERGYVGFVMLFISMHMLYCIFIYIRERCNEEW